MPASLKTQPQHTQWSVSTYMSTEERVMGIEPTPPAWKAGALPLSYTRKLSRPANRLYHQHLREQRSGREIMAGAGFEPAKAEPPDLQSGPFGHSGIPPKRHATAVRNLFRNRYSRKETAIFDQTAEQLKASGGI